MDTKVQFVIKTGFLPSVKVKPLYNFRNKKNAQQRYGTFKAKLKITEQQKNVPDLIDQYYKRFKSEKHKAEPLSVSINFKEITQEQLQAEMARYKQSKLQVKSSKSKNRCSSEGSYAHQLKMRKVAQMEKIRLSTKMILNRLHGNYESQIYRLGSFNEDLKSKYISESKEKVNAPVMHSSQIFVDKKIESCESEKYFMPKGNRKARNLNENRQMSTYYNLSLQKKSKNQDKKIQSFKMPTLQPLPSPWKQEIEQQQYENPEENEGLFQNTISY